MWTTHLPIWDQNITQINIKAYLRRETNTFATCHAALQPERGQSRLSKMVTCVTIHAKIVACRRVLPPFSFSFKFPFTYDFHT